MVQSLIKPDQQGTEDNARRAQQRRLFGPNQIFGLLIAAVRAILCTHFYPNRAWIFPCGWWRRP